MPCKRCTAGNDRFSFRRVWQASREYRFRKGKFVMRVLEGLEPEGFFRFFEDLTQIPRPTFHEEKAADYIEAFAKTHGFAYTRDTANNVLIRVPATSGYEAEAPMLLQAHTDIVAATEPGVTFDFLKDPIRLRIVNGNEIMGSGTTLGADDGSGCAMMLAVADDPDAAHPELELLFTASEEAGMGGITKFDFSQLRSRRMINFDSGRVHSFGVSSVGSVPITVGHSFHTEDAEGSIVFLHLYNGLNGHAGLDVFRNRACTANLIGNLLYDLEKKMPVRLASVKTLLKGIISDCEVRFAVPAGREDEAIGLVKAGFAVINRRFEVTDPDLILDVHENREKAALLTPGDSHKVIDVLFLLQSKAQKVDAENRDYLIASTALTDVGLTDGRFSAKYSPRAGQDSYRDLLAENAAEILSLLGLSYTLGEAHPGWSMKRGSALVELFDRKHRELFGFEAEHRHIHGGIEVGTVCGAIPEMDAVAVIPSMSGAHTPAETLYIDMVKPFWELLTSVLRNKE